MRTKGLILRESYSLVENILTYCLRFTSAITCSLLSLMGLVDTLLSSVVT